MTLTSNTPITHENVGLTSEGECEKCGYSSGDNWSQCGGSCPVPCSPHFRPALAKPAEKEVSVSDAANAQIVGWERVHGFDMPVAKYATPTPPSVDWSVVGPNLVEFVSDFAAQARVGYGAVPVIRSKRVNVPAALFHRAVVLRDELAAAQQGGK